MVDLDHQSKHLLEALLRRAQTEIRTLQAATMAYLRARGLPPEDWANAVGKGLALTWEDAEGQGADRVLQPMLLSLIVAGGKVESVTFGADRSEALVSGFPAGDAVVQPGSSSEEAARHYFQIYAAAAKHLGVTLTWQPDGSRYRLLAVADLRPMMSDG